MESGGVMTRLRFMNGWDGWAGVLAVVSILVFSACAAAPPEESTDMDMSEAEEPVGVTIPEMPVPPAVSINHVMVAQIDHASHALWDAARSEQTPQTDEDWRELEHHAIQLAASGTIIALGGTGQVDPGYVRLVGWSSYAQEMTNVAVSAVQASENQDLDTLVETCEGCHKEFKPELPSEGYLHPHYVGPAPGN